MASKKKTPTPASPNAARIPAETHQICEDGHSPLIEGFGVHTFRFINAASESRFVKFHWRPTIGASAVLWDAAVKISGAVPDFHRRDLWEAIDHGDFPEWELKGLQVFDDNVAASLDFDVLDPTKLIPEEIIPLRMVGKMVLNRNPANHFAETEQVAFCPSHIGPGIGFSDDPLLQGRLFSYLDTQLTRLGGPNFHQIPISAPRCPMRNFQRDGLRQMEVPTGRVAYEPNSLAPDSPRECPVHDLRTLPEEVSGGLIRKRSKTFADHYSQARQFFRSMTEPEQNHIASALAFEQAHVEIKLIRQKVLGHLRNIDPALHDTVALALGMTGQTEEVTPAVTPRDLPTSPSLSLIAKAPRTLKGRKAGILLTDGFDARLLALIQAAFKKENARVALITPKIGGATGDDGLRVEPDFALSGGPSIFFDSVLLLPSADGSEALRTEATAVNWVRDAFAHLKIIGYVAAAQPLLDAASVMPDAGVLAVSDKSSLAMFLQTAKAGRLWEREPSLRSIG